MKFFKSRAVALCISLFAAFIVIGCASPTYYQPRDVQQRTWGYTDRQVDGPLFRVSYIDSFNAGIERTYAYAMYRAAELAREKNATHFEVLEGLLNRGMLEQFIARPIKVGDAGLKTAPTESEVVDVTNQRLIASSSLPAQAVQFQVGTQVQLRSFHQPTFIYVPVQPPPPPQQVTILIRLLSAPSLDPARGFDVQDLLMRLGPKIQRPPLVTTKPA
jgi:hypothetical protein